MEITSFVLGMLTIVAVIILTVIVVGVVKISKLEKEKNSLYQLISIIESDLKASINKHWENSSRIIEDTNRDISMVERTLMQQIEQNKSYIDSRVDKALGTTGAKQVLKG
jgi:hypothetical protein